MSDNGGSYRANIRLNRVEYVDLVTDLESFPEKERPARLRLLLRAGLSALRGLPLPVAFEASFSQAKVIQRISSNGQTHPIQGGLDTHDIDPTNFQFGTP